MKPQKINFYYERLTTGRLEVFLIKMFEAMHLAKSISFVRRFGEGDKFKKYQTVASATKFKISKLGPKN